MLEFKTHGIWEKAKKSIVEKISNFLESKEFMTFQSKFKLLVLRYYTLLKNKL